MKKGDILTAVDPCIDQSGNASLIVGHEYEIEITSLHMFMIKDANGYSHWFDKIGEHTKYFKKPGEIQPKCEAVLFGNFLADNFSTYEDYGGDRTVWIQNAIGIRGDVIVTTEQAYELFKKQNP